MKKLIIVLILCVVCDTVLSQNSEIKTISHQISIDPVAKEQENSKNRVILKTGEEFTGKIKSIDNNLIILDSNGNELRIAVSNIAIIYFSESNNQKNVQQRKSKGILSGVVTYYFNENFGYKPDIGAIVTVHKTTEMNSSKSKFDKYQLAYLYMKHLSYLKKKDPDYQEYFNKLKSLGIETNDDFTKLDNETASILIDITSIKVDLDRENTKQVTVDGAGNYSVELEPGFYEILFQSKGRERLTKTEVRGKIDIQKVEIKPDERSTVDCKFSL
jgi:hypothetical protein